VEEVWQGIPGCLLFLHTLLTLFSYILSMLVGVKWCLTRVLSCFFLLAGV
jgi:hypothetical protein